jgi:serine/threonine-protein kinase
MTPCAASVAALPVPSEPDAAGRRRSNVLGHYRLLRKLGEGAMGAVYQAEDTSNRRIVALKVLHKSVASRPIAVQRFQREARMMEGIDHPNVLRCEETGCIGGWHYLVMEYVDGRSLQAYLLERGRWAVGDALHVILACARGLQHAHEQAMIHRDIKPVNILISAAGQVKIADLGLAKLIEIDDDLTRTGVGVGTPLFMAPEQIVDAKHVDHRCDIYGLGCVLYNLLAGELLFKPDSLLAILDAKRKADLPWLRERNPDVPESLSALVQRMVATRPESRPATCAEVIAEIEALGLAAEHLSFIDPPEPETSLLPAPEAPAPEPPAAQERPCPRQAPNRPKRRTVGQWVHDRSYWIAGLVLGFGAVAVAAELVVLYLLISR